MPVEVGHVSSREIDLGALAGEENGAPVRGQVLQSEPLLVEEDRRQVLGDVENALGLIGQLGRHRGHDLDDPDGDRRGVEDEADVAVATVHHHTARRGGLTGGPGQLGWHAGVEIGTAQGDGLVRAGQDLDAGDGSKE